MRICLSRLTALSLAYCALSGEHSPATDSASAFVHVEGQRLVTGSGGEFHIRAIGTGSTRVDPSEKDYEEVARLKFNAVTVFLSYRPFLSETEPEKASDVGWTRLERHLALARKYGLRVILQMLIVEGAQFVPSKGEAFDYRIWVQPQLQERFMRLWEAIALRYKDEPRIIGYGLFCEPVTSGTRQQWIDLANKTVARIRKIDNHHIIFLERLYGEFGTRREMSGLELDLQRAFFLSSDPNVAYQFYFFERDEYTHQHAPWREDRDSNVHYPDPCFQIVYREAINDPGHVFFFDKNYLKFYLERQLEFGATHKVPMFVWSFGLMKTCFDGQGGSDWLRDTTTLFREHNLNWSFGPYRDRDSGVRDNPDALQLLSRATENR
jgi:Cellulase (glycosyl hydrolase family 5)